MGNANWQKHLRASGFTLCELIIVLVIMTTALTFVVPYVTRSNVGLKVDEVCQDIASAVKYAVDSAVNLGRPVRLVISPHSRNFRLEQAKDITGGIYTSVNGTPGQARFFDERLHITDIDGFEVLGADRYVLIFDPRRPWPRAEIVIASNHVARTIRIEGPLADVQPKDL